MTRDMHQEAGMTAYLCAGGDGLADEGLALLEVVGHARGRAELPNSLDRANRDGLHQSLLMHATWGRGGVSAA